MSVPLLPLRVALSHSLCTSDLQDSATSASSCTRSLGCVNSAMACLCVSAPMFGAECILVCWLPSESLYAQKTLTKQRARCCNSGDFKVIFRELPEITHRGARTLMQRCPCNSLTFPKVLPDDAVIPAKLSIENYTTPEIRRVLGRTKPHHTSQEPLSAPSIIPAHDLHEGWVEHDSGLQPQISLNRDFLLYQKSAETSLE